MAGIKPVGPRSPTVRRGREKLHFVNPVPLNVSYIRTTAEKLWNALTDAGEIVEAGRPGGWLSAGSIRTSPSLRPKARHSAQCNWNPSDR